MIFNRTLKNFKTLLKNKEVKVHPEPKVKTPSKKNSSDTLKDTPILLNPVQEKTPGGNRGKNKTKKLKKRKTRSKR